MELKQLERFLAVIDHGSLAAAARSLGLTQQALSTSLANLEAELAVRLFDRKPGGNTQASEYGHALIKHARAQLAADARARSELSSLRDARVGTVSVGIGETFAGDIIVRAVNQLRRERPRLRINLVEGYSETLLQRLYQGEFDFLAIGVGGFALKEGYRAKSIYSAHDVVACRATHPLAKRRQLTLKDLEGFPWLVPYTRASDTQVIVDTFMAEGLDPPNQLIGSDAYRIGMKLLAQNDFLVMTSPALVTSRLAKKEYGMKVLPIDRPTVRRNASLVTDLNRPMTPAAVAFLETVYEASADFRTGVN